MLNLQQEKFRKLIVRKWAFRWFLWQKLPVALLSGLQVRELTEQKCVVSVPFKRLTQNPFRSVYFASQSMAAEMSTGVPAMMATRGKPPVSMLVLKMEAEFVKKAVSRIWFTCENGPELEAAVNSTLATGEGVTVTCRSTGRMSDGTVVSNFYITWTFKRRTEK